ncbi:hypothetical protein T484DRAFT_1922675 [Baffinella frigidus]|nr:hypothetical protein T484DRAFT_1922675 [Cryptophyta sp. CCMP2293]
MAEQQLAALLGDALLRVISGGSNQEAANPVGEQNTMEAVRTPRESLDLDTFHFEEPLEVPASRPSSANAAHRPPRSILKARTRSSSMNNLRAFFKGTKTGAQTPPMLDTPRRGITFTEDCKACPASIVPAQPAQPSPRRWIAESLTATLSRAAEANTATVAVADAVRASVKYASQASDAIATARRARLAS